MTVRLIEACCLLLAGASILPVVGAAEDKDDPILVFAKSRVKEADKPFTLIVTLNVKEGAGEKFEAAFAKALKATRKEKGCLKYDLNRDSENARRYMVYERWKSLRDLDAHLKSRHIKELLEAVPELVEREPELQILLPAAE